MAKIEKLENIKNKEQFISFIGSLTQDLRNHPESWENTSLEDFLKALAAWVGDIEGFLANQGKESSKNINWQMIANMISAAKYYE